MSGAMRSMTSLRKPALAFSAMERENTLSSTVALSGSPAASAAVTASEAPVPLSPNIWLRSSSLSSSSSEYCERSTLNFADGPAIQLRSRYSAELLIISLASLLSPMFHTSLM